MEGFGKFLLRYLICTAMLAIILAGFHISIGQKQIDFPGAIEYFMNK